MSVNGITSDPVLVVQGVPYRVIFSSGTIVRLKSQGFDFKQTHQELAKSNPVITITVAFQVLAACISHGERKFTGEELADLIPFAYMHDAIALLGAAYAKA